MLFFLSVYPPLPHTVTDEEFVKAQMQKMIDMRVGPIQGFSSGYDYEKDEFKK